MSAIDHAAEAENLIGAGGMDWRNGEVAVAQSTEALVHATLALVEQQRIANLIEVAKGRHADLSDAVTGQREIGDIDGAELAIEVLRQLAHEVDVQVREGLGLS